LLNRIDPIHPDRVIDENHREPNTPLGK